ncbi:hypothetical protein HX13_17485 [Chryseobacterium sp. P1-3]|uniref:Uncharacterized protein n=1 Tax=Chryseobacterium gallinarum TaxID=1324352 RepID=A0A0G3M8Q8_CHRGL|nr:MULTISPECIES: hypothetical protein [Chryseobacterium]AKK73432.1 hypothetical protein OK18_13210 [Chryseobacterium gallinarum]KFF73805.1 hypothetical protein HX13_17485 [Chryseobacterium sp. P1-3]MCL8537157.1 hypothetical protein [Chryseobacterium gallinarum]
MESHHISEELQKNIFISLAFTIAYAVLLAVYEDIPINQASDFLIVLFMVCSLILSTSAIYFAGKSYRKTKMSSVVLIIINSIGLLLPLIILLLLI